MKRRDFLIHGTAIAVGPLLPSGFASIGPKGNEGQSSVLDSAQVIWSSAQFPLAQVAGGGAEQIASSSNKSPVERAPDFHCVFAKEINLPETPSSAVLHLFAFTRYRLYINGAYAGRGPCRYQNQRPEYDSRDIQKFLRTGRNTVVALVHRDAPTGRIMLHEPGFIAALHLRVLGRNRVIATDKSWLSIPELSFGRRATAWSSIEEHIDVRRTIDWMQPDLSMPLWQAANPVTNIEASLFFPRSAPLQMEREMPWSSSSMRLPVDLSQGNEIEFSLAEIAQAFHLLQIDAEVGSAVEATYFLPQGQQSGNCSYIAREGLQTWMGGDTFAFSRLRLRVTAGRMKLRHAVAYEVRYPFIRAASFACSDLFLTQLWSICARSLELLSEDSYVDCADRERVEWIDDSPPAFDCTKVMMRGPGDERSANWGDARLLRGLLRRVALTQQPDGQLKAHTCSERFDVHAIMEDRSCAWVILLREYFESTSDISLVRELWSTLTRLIGWYRARYTTRGLVLAREWEVWDNPLRYQVCEGAGLNAVFYRVLMDASILAERTGNSFSARSLVAEADLLQTHFQRCLWDEKEGAYLGALFGPGSEIRPQMGRPFEGLIVDGKFRPTVQGNLFALYSGIVRPTNVAAVRSWILSHLSEVNSPMSHYYLFRMLYQMQDERQDTAVLRLMRKNWKNQVDSAWQTTWETLEESDASKAHIYGMHPGYFLTAYVLGARTDGPVDQKTILIEPRFSDLEWANGVCVTEFGPVQMSWTMDASRRPAIVCTIPNHVTAKFRLRCKKNDDTLEVDGVLRPTRRSNDWLEFILAPGKHSIRLRSSTPLQAE